ncbi:MAG: SPOR domain-containing protein [Treponema sp.]|nr:SPOR domain-containing protein [Treponema sp.]
MRLSRLFLGFALFCVSSPLFALSTAQEIKSQAMQKASIDDSISYIHSSIKNAASDADKRSLYYFVGTLEELTGLYDEASSSYAKAAGIAAGDAKGMPKVTTEQIVIDAVRCSLNCGDYSTAESYLNSSVRSSKNQTILAHVKLYSVWADLCRAKNVAETAGSVATLKAYAESEYMKSVRPAVLLTLWYITGSGQYGEEVKKQFPNSPEAGIVKGSVNVLSVPFWYFVPRAVSEAEVTSTNSFSSASSGKTTASTTTTTTTTTTKTTVTTTTGSAKTETSTSSAKTEKKVREQLGLFRNKENADTLIKDLKAKGFTGYSYTETRASGTTYYIVVVDENKDGTMGKKLRAAGFDCYPVEY